MQKLVYEGIYIKDGIEFARVPAIVGYVGAYTAVKQGKFTITYNVR